MKAERSKMNNKSKTNFAPKGLSRKQHEILARHEAGHAVMTYLLGQRFEYVTIEPNEINWGHLRRRNSVKFGFELMEWTVFNKNGFVPPQYYKRPEIKVPENIASFVEGLMMADYAGAIAEHIYLKKDKRTLRFRNDEPSDVNGLPESVTSSPAECAAYRRYLRERVWNLFQIPAILEAVEALAVALLKKPTIRYREACQLIEGSFTANEEAHLEWWLKCNNIEDRTKPEDIEMAA